MPSFKVILITALIAIVAIAVVNRISPLKSLVMGGKGKGREESPTPGKPEIVDEPYNF